MLKWSFGVLSASEKPTHLMQDEKRMPWLRTSAMIPQCIHCFFPFDLKPPKTLNKRHILVGSLDGRSDWQTRWNSSAIGATSVPDWRMG